jgi:hypothetical protein
MASPDQVAFPDGLILYILLYLSPPEIQRFRAVSAVFLLAALAVFYRHYTISVAPIDRGREVLHVQAEIDILIALERLQ